MRFLEGRAVSSICDSPRPGTQWALNECLLDSGSPSHWLFPWTEPLPRPLPRKTKPQWVSRNVENIPSGIQTSPRLSCAAERWQEGEAGLVTKARAWRPPLPGRAVSGPWGMLEREVGEGKEDLEGRSVKGRPTGCWQGPLGEARTGGKTPQPLPSTHTCTQIALSYGTSVGCPAPG